MTTEETNDTATTNMTTVNPVDQPPTPPNFGGDTDKDPSKNSWNNVDDISECRPAFDDLMERYGFFKDILEWMKRSREDMDRYQNNLNLIFENSTINISSLESHRKCREHLDEYADIVELFVTILELADNLTKSETLEEAYSYAVQIPPFYKRRIKYETDYFEEFDTNLREACDWLRKSGQEMRVDGGRVGREFGNAKDQKDTALRHFATLTELFNKLYKEIVDKIDPTTSTAKEYMNGSVEKTELCQEFETPVFTKAIEDLSDTNRDLVEILKDYVEEMTIGLGKMKKAYNNLFGLELPVLNSYNIYQLELVQRAAEINDTLLQNVMNNVENNTEDTMNDLVTETYQRLIAPIEEMENTLTDPVDDILSHIGELDEALKDYKESSKMNTEFFM